MRTRLATAAVIVLSLTGCTASSTAQPPSEASPQHTSKPTPTAATGEPPAEFSAGMKRLFPDQETGLYEAAGFHCMSLDSSEGDFDQAGKALILDVQMSSDQAVGFMDMSTKYVCPTWSEAFAKWRYNGGEDRLTAVQNDGP